jgi:SAM-dependent methyltransferase
MEVPITRTALSSQLAGEGIEIGAGHWPFPVPASVTKVTYVSRHSPEDERRLFPEVSDDHDFGHVDVIADMDRDGLAAFSDNSQDFLIASHVVEHLAAPIWAISEFLRVVRPGGYVVLVLPDRRMTFDRDRDPTPVEHLIREHGLGTRDVDELHIREFLAKTGSGMRPSLGEIELHRARSVHAHCWTDAEFRELLDALIERFGMSFSIVESYDAQAGGGTGIEFAFLLRVGEFSDETVMAFSTPNSDLEQTAAYEQSISDVVAENDRLREELRTVYSSRTWRLGAIPRAVKQKISKPHA